MTPAGRSGGSAGRRPRRRAFRGRGAATDDATCGRARPDPCCVGRPRSAGEGAGQAGKIHIVDQANGLNVFRTTAETVKSPQAVPNIGVMSTAGTWVVPHGLLS